MARIHMIERPETGKVSYWHLSPGKFAFAFPFSEAAPERDGDSLLLGFPDGSAIELRDFYAKYDAINLPPFIIDGAEVDTYDFLASFGRKDLMPAGRRSTPKADDPRSGDGMARAGINLFNPCEGSETPSDLSAFEKIGVFALLMEGR